jgi:hypothetical protein
MLDNTCAEFLLIKERVAKGLEREREGGGEGGWREGERGKKLQSDFEVKKNIKKSIKENVKTKLLLLTSIVGQLKKCPWELQRSCLINVDSSWQANI